MLASDSKTTQAYQFCMNMAQSHYENFPVASRLLKKQIRYPVSAVYAFARSADDFADEGEWNQQERLALLTEFEQELNNIQIRLKSTPQSCELQPSTNPVFIALEDVIKHFNVPVTLFYNLLEAFKQDVVKTRYSNFAEVLDYCKNSANPVGRILLYLNHSAEAENLYYSDAICTGLQLINFYQDIAQDINENNRLYLPVDEMKQTGVSIADLRQQINTPETRKLLELQLHRARSIYTHGQPLCKRLSGRFAIEISIIYHGGIRVLNKLEQNTSNIYLRPRLNRKDKLFMIWQGLFCRFH